MNGRRFLLLQPPDGVLARRSRGKQSRHYCAQRAKLLRRCAPRKDKEHGMAEYDLVIRNATVVTAADTQHCDIGIKDGVIATLGRGLAAGAREIDAGGKLVLPGAIDSHCHIEQKS